MSTIFVEVPRFSGSKSPVNDGTWQILDHEARVPDPNWTGATVPSVIGTGYTEEEARAIVANMNEKKCK